MVGPGPGPWIWETESGSSAQVLALYKHGVNDCEQSSSLCSVLSGPVYHVTLPEAHVCEERAADRSMAGVALPYLIIENNKPSDSSIKGALFHRLPSPSPDRDGIVQLSYRCPVTLSTLERDLGPDERHAIVEVLPRSTRIAVKYGQSPLHLSLSIHRSQHCLATT